MDKLTFISKLIEYLAWPATVIILVVILKNPISLLLKRLSKFKHKDWEFDFEKELKEAQLEAENIPITQIKKDTEIDQTIDKANEILTVDPNSAIVFAWSELEIIIRKVLEEKRVDVPKNFSPTGHLDLLVKNEILNKEQVDYLHTLRKLRNSAVHKADNAVVVTKTQAIAYIELYRRFYNYLKAYKNI